MKIVCYRRVSTDRQSRSGLGLEAQQKALEAFQRARKATVVDTFTEAESGRKNDRPELQKAMRLARITGSKLVIAKLDRLSRNAAFLLNLQASGVDFVACDIPEANEMTVGIMAVVAQAESAAISARTMAAMGVAKERGRAFGNPNGAAALRRAGKGNTAACAAQARRADARATDLADTLSDIESAGHTTLAAIAGELNRREIKTARGGKWHASTVRNLRARLANSTTA